MQFKPKTEKQIREEQLFPKGDYDATVISAEDTRSKAGNDMIKVGLRVYDESGKSTIVNDFLMEAMLGKLLHFCEAAGLKDKYDAGTLRAADCLNADVRVALVIKEDKTGQYADQNNVKDYKPREGAAATIGSEAASKAEFDPASIPF